MHEARAGFFPYKALVCVPGGHLGGYWCHPELSFGAVWARRGFTMWDYSEPTFSPFFPSFLQFFYIAQADHRFMTPPPKLNE